MMSESNLKKYFVWLLVENQPNVVEKLVGFLRRSCKKYCIEKLYFGPADVDDLAVFTVEVSCSERDLKRLLKVYDGYVEVVEVWYKPVGEETIFNESEHLKSSIRR